MPHWGLHETYGVRDRRWLSWVGSSTAGSHTKFWWQSESRDQVSQAAGQVSRLSTAGMQAMRHGWHVSQKLGCFQLQLTATKMGVCCSGACRGQELCQC